MAKKEISAKIVLSADSSQLIDETKKIKKELSATRSELSTLEQGFKFEVDSNNVKRAMELASKAVQAASQNVDNLKKRLAELGKENTDEARAEIEAISRELSFADTRAKKAQEQLERINKVALDNVSKQIDNIKNKFENVTKQIDSAGASLTKIGKGATTYITAPIAALGIASFKLSSDMAESMNKVEVVFGDSAESIKAWANTTLQSYGIANMTALDMTAFFGDMATSMGFTEAQAAKMAQSLVALSGDVASFKNIGLEQVQTALSGIFTGETESLKRLGVVMTETNLEAYALRKGLGDVYGEMDQASKVALRYEYIMETLKNANGDFANTSDSSANQLRMLQESLKQIGATFGNELAPVITPILQNINKMIQSFATMDDGTKKLIVTIAIAAAAFGPLMLVGGQLSKVVSGLVTLFGLLRTATAAKATADAAATTSQYALNASMAANPIGAVITAITTLVALIGSVVIANQLMADSQEKLSDKLIETADSYTQVKKSINDNTESRNAELSLVQKLIPKFEELNGKVNKTLDEKNELKFIVDKINEILPDTIGLIDSETGAYKLLHGSIQDVINAKKAEMAFMAKEQLVKEAYSNIESLKKSPPSEETLGKAKEFEDAKEVTIWRGDKNKSIFLKGIRDAYNEVQEYNRQMQEYQNEIAGFDAKYEQYIKSSGFQLNLGSSTGGGSTGGGSSTSAKTTTQKTPAEKELDAFRAAQKEIQYLRDMGVRNETWYYNQLESLQDKYLRGNLDEWRRVDVEIHNYQVKQAEEAKRAAEEAAKAAEQQRKDNLANFERYVDEVSRLAQQEADERIKAIDEQAAAYDRLMAKQDQEKRLTQAQSKLAFEMDDYNRKQIQQEIARLQKEMRETEMKQAIADQKAVLQDNIASIQAMADQAKRQATAAANNTTNTSNTTNNNAFTTNIDAKGLTEAQVEMMIANALNRMLRSI